MDLITTVSQILNRRVDENEAKTYACDNFGQLAKFIKRFDKLKKIKRLSSKIINHSPILKVVNFENNSCIKLLKVSTNDPNVQWYAIHETTNCITCSNGLHKTFEKANNKFDQMVEDVNEFQLIASTREYGQNEVFYL